MPAALRMRSAASEPRPSNEVMMNCRSVRASRFAQHFGQRFARDFLHRVDAPVGQRHFDQERIAAIHGRRTGGRGIELAGHDVRDPLQQQLLADRRNAVGRRGADLRALDGLVQRIGFAPPDPAMPMPAG